MPAVFVRNNNVDGALKTFKAQVAKEGNLSKAKDRAEGYKKTGLKNRIAKEINTRNCRKNNKKNNNRSYNTKNNKKNNNRSYNTKNYK